MQKKILFGILNWGLGHATRCSPMIEALQHQNQVYVASSGLALEWIQHRFPKVTCLDLSHDLEVSYSKYWPQWLKQATKARQWSNWLKQDEIWLNNQAIHYDLVLSDGRPGFHQKGSRNIFISHQLHVLLPRGIHGLVNRRFWAKMEHFNHLWVPDFEHGISRSMNQDVIPSHLKAKVNHIGFVSQFMHSRLESVSEGFGLAILSGPEPHRSIMEASLNSLQQKFPLKIIGGKQGDLASTTEIISALKRASYVICRTGYSSIMDQYFLQKPCIWVPTPGQDEQVILGKELKKLGQKVFTQKELKEKFAPFAAKRLTPQQFNGPHLSWGNLLLGFGARLGQSNSE